jgi:hypothetical protein
VIEARVDPGHYLDTVYDESARPENLRAES